MNETETALPMGQRGFIVSSASNAEEAARRLNMHRRTLQRILAKRSPNE